MDEKKTIVIIGAGYDALYAASSARLANGRARIIVIADSDCHMLDADKADLLNDTGGYKRLAPDDVYKKKYSIEILRRAEAHSLDVDAQTLGVFYQGSHERYSYDTLIFAPQGRRSQKDSLSVLPSVQAFDTEHDICAIRQALVDGARTVVVVGLSLLGIHACTLLKSLGVEVIALDEKSRIMPEFSWLRSQAILDQMRKLPIDVRLNIKVVKIEEAAAKSLRIFLSHGETIICDRILDCRSLMPDVELLADAGVLLDSSSLIVVNDNLHTTLPNIYACGLSVAAPRSVTHEKSFMPYEAVRERLATLAGKNAALGSSRAQEKIRPNCGFLRVLIEGRMYARSGLGEQEAREFCGDEGFFSLSVVHQSPNLGMKLLLKKPSNTIIGAEFYGHQVLDALVPVITLSIQQGLSLEDIRSVEFSDTVLQRLIDDAALSAHGATLEDLPLVHVENIALWMAHRKDFSMIDIDDEPSSWGALANKAVHIPLEDLPKRVGDISHYAHPLVLYSRSSSTRYLAHKMLASYGVGPVFQLDGAGHDRALFLSPGESLVYE